MDDVADLQAAGCFSVVIECVPEKVASLLTNHIQIPTIGIGAGNACSGQVLVQSDLLGMDQTFLPKYFTSTHQQTLCCLSQPSPSYFKSVFLYFHGD